MRYLINKKNQKIAYSINKGKSPGLIFIHGLNSDMTGKKALSIHKYAKKNNLNFIRFDCRGHGKSFGKFEDFTITDWKEDLFDIIDHLTKGPQILIGSSMGGWLMTLAAKRRYQKVAGLIGLAATVDFGQDLYSNLTIKNKKEIRKFGLTNYKSYGFAYIIKKKFFSEAKKNNVLNKTIKFNKPVILIHGIKDNVVNQEMPKKLIKFFKTDNQQIYYLKSSDHRLSKSEDLITINSAIDNMRKMI